MNIFRSYLAKNKNISLTYMELCKYKNIFGEPRTGVHSIRIADFAIVDIILTIFAGIVISRLLNIPLFYVLVILFLSSIIIHRIFCVQTKMVTLIFGDLKKWNLNNINIITK